MPAVSTTIYTCDRDAYVSEPSSAGLPAGWTTLQCLTTSTPPPPVEGQPATPPIQQNSYVLLCPGCSAQFVAFKTPAKAA